MARDMEKLAEWAEEVLDDCTEEYEWFEQFMRTMNAKVLFDGIREEPVLEFQTYDVALHTGASRLVLAPDNSNYVLKIQYRDLDEYEYCANEARLYAEAEKAGLAEYFAWSAKILDYPMMTADGVVNREIYIMEKCKVDEEAMSSDSTQHGFRLWCADEGLDADDSDAWERFENEEDIDYYSNQEGMLDYAIEFWGVDAARNVGEFLDSYYCNDCHSGNFGYIDKRLVICDYAGYGRDLEF